MFEILFVIVISIIVYKRVQKAKGNVEPQNTPAQPPVNRIDTSVRTMPPAKTKVPAPKTLPEKAKTSATGEAKAEGCSTTAYLMEKAEADAREHAKEKYEEQKRLYETRGGLAVAERHFDGDPVPQGRQCIKCGYCGAENLLPMIPRTRYSCYFCREAL